ncbi:hypothetical protein Tco_1439368 [Tanacetum coccineum]
MVPRTVLTSYGSISLNAARPVNTVQSKTAVNNAGPMKNIINNAYSTARRPFNKITTANNSNFNKRVNIVNDKNVNAAKPSVVVNTARPKAVLSAVKGNKENVVKASACWVWRPKHKVLDHVSRNNDASMSFKRFDYGNPQQDLKHKGVIDSGCSRHMIGNISYLTNYEEIDGGFVAFEDFKLTDESHVLLKVPRNDNMYSVDLKDVKNTWDSPFDLEAYSDSDYAGASLDRKSTTGGCQFLRSRLISWQCKKQIVVANSTTEAEYMATASCCGQVLWIQNQMLDYGYNFINTKIFIDNEITICIVKNPVFHSKTKHIEIRHHFIRDSNKKKLIQMIKIHTDQNVADLLTKAFDVSRFQYLIASIGMLNL